MQRDISERKGQIWKVTFVIPFVWYRCPQKSGIGKLEPGSVTQW